MIKSVNIRTNKPLLLLKRNDKLQLVITYAKKNKT